MLDLEGLTPGHQRRVGWIDIRCRSAGPANEKRGGRCQGRTSRCRPDENAFVQLPLPAGEAIPAQGRPDFRTT